jgi:hypothetical protein
LKSKGTRVCRRPFFNYRSLVVVAEYADTTCRAALFSRLRFGLGYRLGSGDNGNERGRQLEAASSKNPEQHPSRDRSVKCCRHNIRTLMRAWSKQTNPHLSCQLRRPV